MMTIRPCSLSDVVTVVNSLRASHNWDRPDLSAMRALVHLSASGRWTCPWTCPWTCRDPRESRGSRAVS